MQFFYLYLKMLLNVKFDVRLQKVLPFKVADINGIFIFQLHGQKKVGNIAILVLWKDHEKL